MPTRDIDGRGNTTKEAVEDMWNRMVPLQEEGYHPVSSVEIVDTKTNKVIESFMLTDPEWAYLRERDTRSSGSTSGSSKKGGGGGGSAAERHRPPSAHEFPFKARVKLQL